MPEQSTTAPASADTVEVREAQFWDDIASVVSDEQLLNQAVPDAPDTRCRLELLGPISRETKILDIGCGLGLWTCHLAKLGAEVWAIDISPQSVAVTRRRAQLNGLADRVHAGVMSATNLAFLDASFSLVHGQDIMHHVEADAFGKEVARVLVDDGAAVFSENSANNPVLMLARNYLCGRFGISKWGSDDEYPLTRAKRRQFAVHFQKNLQRYPEFRFLFLFDAKLFHYKKPLVTRFCRGFDGFVGNYLPFLRQYSYRQVLQFSRPVRSGRP